MSIKRLAISLAVVALGALLALPGSASADTKFFSNQLTIPVPDQGVAGLYPVGIRVADLRGPVKSVEVSLNAVSHTEPQDLDILLVPPRGRPIPMMSDACGAGTMSNVRLSFDSDSLVDQPMGSSCFTNTYRPTDQPIGAPDTWPGAPAPPYASGSLSHLHGEDPTGVWQLYVYDDSAGNSGSILGWSLTITTSEVDTLVPGGVGTMGTADRYPATRTVAGVDGVITDVNVISGGLYHPRPDDVDTLLVGPQGQKVILMSDACGSFPTRHRTWRFDDESNTTFTSDSGANEVCPSGTYQPIDHEPGERLPLPAPDIPYATSLSAFDLTDPNGEWRLYTADDMDGESGWFERPFDLQLQTRPKAEVAFAADAVEVAEGQAATLTVRRSGPDQLGAGSVTVATRPVTAEPGADFTPVSTVVEFAAGEREQTVQLAAAADAGVEGAETFAVELSSPSGDAATGTPASVTATIPAQAAGPGAGGGERIEPPKPRCAGKTATIIGSPGRDVLRGTRRADVIVGLGGNDRITAAGGNDVVCAGPGNDTVSGGAGNDRLFGEAGRDRLVGGAGADRLTGGSGRDTCVRSGRDRAACERR
jgi:subtilisin-like proprotein convertase family protein